MNVNGAGFVKPAPFCSFSSFVSSFLSFAADRGLIWLERVARFAVRSLNELILLNRSFELIGTSLPFAELSLIDHVPPVSMEEFQITLETFPDSRIFLIREG